MLAIHRPRHLHLEQAGGDRPILHVSIHDEPRNLIDSGLAEEGEQRHRSIELVHTHEHMHPAHSPLSIAEDDVDTAFDQLPGRGGHRPSQEQRIPRLDLLVVDEVQILQAS